MFITLCLFSVLMLIAQIPSVKEWFIWNDELIFSGEIWRILSGNFTHFNIEHLSMNMFGLWLIVWIFHLSTFSLFSSKIKASHMKNSFIIELIIPIILISLAVGVALFFTDIHSYVGLSGTLHGLFGFYALREFFIKKDKKEKLFSSLFILGLLTKVLSEQFFGSLTSSQDLIGSEIATQAHFAGAIAGLILALCLQLNTKLMSKAKT